MSVTKFRKALVELLLEITGEGERPQRNKKRKKLERSVKGIKNVEKYVYTVTRN